MAIAVAFVGKDKMFVVVQENQIIIDFDIVFIFFGINNMILTTLCIGKQQFKFVLMAVHAVNAQHVGILSPFYARDILIGFVSNIHFSDGFRIDVVHKNVDNGIGFTGFGIFILMFLRI